MISNVLNKILTKSELAKNVLTLMTGTTIAQAIPIAISPILTRLYSPEDFGIFALFVAISSIFGSIANGRYELAIMLPKKDADAISIFVIGFIINFVTSLVLFTVILIFHNYMASLIGNEATSHWLYFIPISVFLIGAFNLLNFFNNRKKFYKDLARANVYKSFVAAVVQITFGLLKVGAGGLISGQIVSQIISNILLFFSIKKYIAFRTEVRVKVLIIFRKYKNFPMYSLPGALINTLSFSIVNILIPVFFDVTTLGFYSLAQKVLGIPVSIIGSSIGQVFFKEATVEKNLTGKAIKSFSLIFKKLLVIGSVLFIFLFFEIENIIKILFGTKWSMAGIYAKIMISIYFFKFISYPLSFMYDIFNALKIELIWNILLVIGLLSILYFSRYDRFEDFLSRLSIFYSLMYIVSLYIIYRLAKGDKI